MSSQGVLDHNDRARQRKRARRMAPAVERIDCDVLVVGGGGGINGAGIARCLVNATVPWAERFEQAALMQALIQSAPSSHACACA